MAERIEPLTATIAKVEQASVRLAESRDTGFAAATLLLTSSLYARADALRERLSDIFEDCDTELTLQLLALQGQLMNTQIAFTTGTEAIGKPDLEVVKLKIEIAQ